jgi:hypothetical protein
MKRSTRLFSIGIWLSSMAIAFFIGRNLSLDHTDTGNTEQLTSLQSKLNRRTQSSDKEQQTGNASMQSISGSLISTDGEESISLALNKIGSLKPNEIRDLIETAFAMPMSDPNRAQVIDALLTQLAAKSPLDALELANQIGSLRDSERAKNTILEIWATKDPTAALKWAQAALVDAPSNLRNSQMRAIIRGYAKMNPAAAFQYANSLEATTVGEMRQKSRLLSEVIETQIQNGGLDEARTAIEMLPEDSNKDSLFRKLVNEWASFDPVSAAAYVSSLGPDAPSSLKNALVSEWAENDPVAAAAWLSALPADDPAIANTAAEIIREWTRYDLTASAEWLNSLPDSPSLDRAVASYTYRAAEEDPATAMSWAESISNDEMRTRLMERVAASWKSTDTSGFESYLNSSDLNKQQKQLLLEAKTHGGYGGGFGRPPR